ncbi:MAG: SgcJ/EcaC family oxidoreductase [Myxacorys californica WJT36-NPBG1]|jgi:uncharacterized protein (TIGR02246 family)|nr:SgcJ/EcaC family oxidoreductase [Myxacorys californica WJT36-NPBG1]
MNSQTAQTTTAANKSAIRDFLHQMIEAWNRGSGEDFAAPFSETADFIAFKGMHLKGRKEIAAFNQQTFDTVVKGTRLEGEVNFVRFVNSQLALMSGVVRVMLPGQPETSPSRDSMQLFVVMKRDRDWQNERHRRKRTVYHFAPLARSAARFRSTAPFGRCVFRTQQAAGNQTRRD